MTPPAWKCGYGISAHLAGSHVNALAASMDWMARSGLVQRWAWFEGAHHGGAHSQLTALAGTGGLTATGGAYRDYVRRNLHVLKRGQ